MLGVHMLTVYVKSVMTPFACVKDTEVSGSVQMRKFVSSLFWAQLPVHAARSSSIHGLPLANMCEYMIMSQSALCTQELIKLS